MAFVCDDGRCKFRFILLGKEKEMKKITKLKICDWLLLVVMVMVLASSIQQEGWWLGLPFVWLHIALGIVFFLFIGSHLKLHFQWKNWLEKLMQQKSHVTKWLAALGALTLLTALAATVHMFITWQHSAVGGWHGKIGFMFIALTIGHAVKRIKFYKKK